MAEIVVKVSRFHRDDGRIFFQTFLTLWDRAHHGVESMSWQETFMGYESGPVERTPPSRYQ